MAKDIIFAQDTRKTLTLLYRISKSFSNQYIFPLPYHGAPGKPPQKSPH